MPPTTTPFTESRHAGGYVVTEIGNQQITRAAILLASGSGKCQAGTVIAIIEHALTGTAAAVGSVTGNPTFGAITVGAGADVGDYIVRMVAATNFVVENPKGEQIGGKGTLGTPFAAGGLSFTFTAGGTPAVAGDTWKISVAAGSGKYVPYDPTGTDGREEPGNCAILFGEVDATSADKKAVAHVRGPLRVNAAELVWGAGVTTTQHKTDALAALVAKGILST